jgi:fructose-1,6-bisphosphatase/inositol monophosphatase family enzyme
MAAGMLIAGEAGCLVTDYDGRGGCLERGEIVAANPAIHSQMLRKIQGK